MKRRLTVNNLEINYDENTDEITFKKDDKHIAEFLEQIKKERERREFGLLLNR